MLFVVSKLWTTFYTTSTLTYFSVFDLDESLKKSVQSCNSRCTFVGTVLQFTFNIVPTTQLSVFDCSLPGHIW